VKLAGCGENAEDFGLGKSARDEVLDDRERKA
jgi:hypothetical protein